MRHSTAQRIRHPARAWLWAVGGLLLLLAGRSEHPESLSIALIAAAIGMVMMTPLAPYRRRVFYLALVLSLTAILIRLLAAILIGVPMPGRTLFVIPEVQLPDFLVGIRLGGPVTSQRLTSALSEILVFAAIIVVLASASAVTTPYRLLRVLPQRFYGLGLATSIAASVAPQTASSISRVNLALRMRGDQSRGLHRARRVLMPVLEESLERSIDLAAALEVRGYGSRSMPTRYRPEKWELTDLLLFIGIALLFFALPVMALPAVAESLFVFALFLMMSVM
ncbi:MAG: hypothetical protein RLZZ251_869 [Actinomycetota bacterium]|jgi:energy-coupling factor transporter transmembrane protein EcfT